MSASTVNGIDSAAHENAELLLPWYVNGTLSEAERLQVAAHVETCSSCRTAVAELETIASSVGRNGVTPIVPKPDVQGLMDRLDQAERRAPPRRPLYAAAAAVLLSAALAFFSSELGSLWPKTFVTVTDGSSQDSIDLVFDVTFARDIDADGRARILEAFGLPTDGEMIGERTYRVAASRPSASPAEINGFTERLAAAEGVVAAIVEMRAPPLPAER